jgi:hypothetical protein
MELAFTLAENATKPDPFKIIPLQTTRREDRRNVGGSSCNSGDGTDQRVQSLMFLMMIMMMYRRLIEESCLYLIIRLSD